MSFCIVFTGNIQAYIDDNQLKLYNDIMKDFMINETHPRLYFDKNDITRVKNQIPHNSKMQEWLKKLEQSAEELLKMEFYTEEHANSVNDQHGRFGDVTGQIKKLAHVLGILYQITGKPEYAKKLKEAMLHISAFKAYAGPSNKNRDTPWKSELQTSAFVENFALAWDCIYDTLDENDKITISGAMIRNGITPLMEDWVLPGTRVHALDSMGHNWWAVCAGLAGVGICAIYEYIPQADEWLKQVRFALDGFVNYGGELLINKTANFDDKGLFYEGPRYACYGVGEMSHFHFVYSRCFENSVNYPAELMARAFVSTVYPTSDEKKPYLFVNIGDTNYQDLMLQIPMYFTLLNEYKYSNINESDLYLLKEIYRINRNRTAEADAMDFVYYDILWDEKPVDLSELPLNAIHQNGGLAVMRSSWEKDALLFAVRCGHTWNHAHDDGGGFIFFNKGEPLLTDLGTYYYSSPLYHGYITHAKGHNVVIANGTGQFHENHGRGTKFPGTISHYMENDWCAYFLADATGPLCDRFIRNYRSFIRLYADCFLILDDIRMYQPSVFEWLLHYEGEAQINNGGKEIVVNNNGAEVKVVSVFPPNVAIEKKDVYSNSFHPDKKLMSYLSLANPRGIPDREAAFLHFVSPDTSLTVNPLKSKECIGAEFTRGNAKIEMYYNQRADGRKMHENSNNLLGGYETDAYILVKTTENEKSRFLMVYGSYLRKDGVSIYENFAKKFVFVDE